jgi:uncharacterized protein YuzE
MTDLKKWNYHKDTDSLYMKLSEHPYHDSVEVMDNVVLDFDADGRLIGIEVYGDVNEIVDLPYLKRIGILNESDAAS